MKREKPPSVGHSPTATATSIISKDLSSEVVTQITGFFNRRGISENIPHNYTTKDSHSDFIRGLFVKVDLVQRGRISCRLSVKPAVTNAYGTLHGGAVASVAEIMSIACARTVVGEDKELFLGELSTTYLSAAPHKAELTVDASVIKSGRSLTLIVVEFKAKDTGKLVYTSHATFYHMPVASL